MGEGFFRPLFLLGSIVGSGVLIVAAATYRGPNKRRDMVRAALLFLVVGGVCVSSAVLQYTMNDTAGLGAIVQSVEDVENFLLLPPSAPWLASKTLVMGYMCVFWSLSLAGSALWLKRGGHLHG